MDGTKLNPTEVVIEARRLVLSRGVDAARSHLEASSLWPDDPAALRWAAQVCAHGGLLEAAVRFWERVEALDGGPDARAALVRLALFRGRLEEARRRLPQLLGEAPDHGEGWLLKGVIAIQDADWEAAEGAFDGAYRRGADARRARLGKAMAQVSAGRCEVAWDVLTPLAMEYPADEDVLHWLLRAGVAQEKWDELAVALEAHLAAVPDSDSGRFALAGIEVRRGRIDRARHHFTELLDRESVIDGLDELAAAIDRAEDRCSPAISSALEAR